MPENIKGFSGAPFGVQSARFRTEGVHPKHIIPGTSMSECNRNLGPGSYDIDRGSFSARTLTAHCKEPGWARAYETQKMASLPCLLHREQWESKRLLKEKLGPGTYNYRDFLEMMGNKSGSNRGMLHMKEPRFQDTVHSMTPGPGTYGKGGVPHAVMEEKSHRSPGTVGMLECGGTKDRMLPLVGCSVGPGTYNVTPSVDQLLNKVVSLQGPYELFSADRNKPIKTGHYATLKTNNLGPGQYNIKSGIDELNAELYKRKGKFSTMVQYPEKPTDRVFFTLAQHPRQPSEPGPGHYEACDYHRKPSSQSKKSPPFLSSSQRSDKMATKFFTGNFNSVGAGRYDIQKADDLYHVNGHESVFKSTTDRPDPSKLKYLQERLRGSNMPAEQGMHLVYSDRARPEGRKTHVRPEGPKTRGGGGGDVSRSVEHSQSSTRATEPVGHSTRTGTVVKNESAICYNQLNNFTTNSSITVESCSKIM